MTGHGENGTMEVLQVPSELEPMVDLYCERKPLRVLEIGCWDGGTLREWLEQAVPDAVVVAVDLEHRNAETYEEWRKPDTELLLYTGSSLEPEGIAFIREHGPYDWVFVDGDHGDYGVRSDVGVCLPLVTPGGLMLIHDVTPPSGDASYPPQVVFDELGTLHETWSFQDPAPASWSRGIGVVQL